MVGTGLERHISWHRGGSSGVCAPGSAMRDRPAPRRRYTSPCPGARAALHHPNDENDESLQRYKQSLGLGGGKDLSDPNDPRVCIILSLSMESPGRDPVVIDLSAPGSEKKLKDKPFKIKAGAKFTMIATFKVQHEILSGLHYVQSIKYLGIRIPGGKSSEMIGSYAPNTDKTPVYVKKFAEEEAPNMSKKFSVHSKFIDDDGKTHLEFDWAFQIDKDW